MRVLLLLLIVVVIALLAGFFLPSKVHVERQTLVDAPPQKVFSQVSDFNAWRAWSPWANIDPDATFKIEGAGVGQTMTWASDNPEVGTGSQKITTLEAPRKVVTHLDFGDMGVSDASFTLEPTEGITLVTWSLDSDMREGVPLVKKPMNTYFGFFMDSMLGNTYEQGLANLKAVVEG